MLYREIDVMFVYNFAPRKFDFKGTWSATPQNRGWPKKTEGQNDLKSAVVVWQWVATFKEAIPPPPPPHTHTPLGLYSSTSQKITKNKKYIFTRPLYLVRIDMF